MVSQIIANGIYSSLSTMLIIVGLAMMFSIMQIVFLAYGFLFVLAAYVIWYLRMVQDWNYISAALVGLAAAIIAGIILERVFFRRHRGYLLPCMIVSLGLNMVLETGLLLGVDKAGFGLDEKTITPFVKGTLTIFGAVISWERFWIAIAGIAVLIVGMIFINGTKTGKAMKAVSQDPQAAAVLGVNINRLTVFTMATVSALAGIYGILIAPMNPITPQAGLGPILLAFLVVITGGAGSIGGAVLAAFAIGFLSSITTSLGSPYLSSVVVYLVIFLVLAIKPKGLFGYHLHI